MPPLECPECQTVVSACPHCGHPLQVQTNTGPRRGNVSRSGWAIVAVLLAAGVAGLLQNWGPASPGSTGGHIQEATPQDTVAAYADPPTHTEGPTDTPSPTETLVPPATRTAAARQTATAIARAAATATAEAIIRESPWVYNESPDEMGRGVTRTAMTISPNSISFDFPYNEVQYPVLMLRRSPKFGLDVMVRIDSGQFLCPSYDGCRVNVRFGSGRVQRFGANGPSDHSTNVLFLDNASGFIAALKKAPTVSVEAEFYQAGWRVLTFKTQHLQWK